MVDKKETKRKLKDLEESFEIIDLEKEEEKNDKITIVDSSTDSNNDNEDDVVEINDETSSSTMTANKKIKLSNEKEINEKPKCKYGSSCYRKNRQHFDEFDHPNVEGKIIQRKKKQKY